MNTRKALETAARVGAYAALGSAGSALAWYAVSSLAINHRRKLNPAIPGVQPTTFESAAGQLSYYSDTSGEGRPLLLLHSINAASSSIEIKPLFERYRGTRPVYALDLPGYGFSSRNDRAYTIDLYRRAIIEMIEQIPGEHPVDVIALSLSAEFAALAALKSPHSIRSLTMISPTGFSAPDKSSGGGLTVPVAKQAFYDLLTSRPSLTYYLNKSFAGHVPTELASYSYETSHQPGALYAPLAFLRGTLFTPEIRARVFSAMQVPVLVLYDKDGYVNFGHLDMFVRNHMNWVAVRIPGTRGMPHWEKRADTAAALEYFWKENVPVLSAALGRDTERTSACVNVGQALSPALNL